MLQRWHGARRWDTYTTATSCLFVFSVQILDKRWHGIRTSNPPGVMYDHGRKIVHGTDGFCRAFCDDSPFAYTDGSSVAHVCFLLRLFVFFFPSCHFLFCTRHISVHFAIYERPKYRTKHLQLAHGALSGRAYFVITVSMQHRALWLR